MTSKPSPLKPIHSAAYPKRFAHNFASIDGTCSLSTRLGQNLSLHLRTSMQRSCYWMCLPLPGFLRAPTAQPHCSLTCAGNRKVLPATEEACTVTLCSSCWSRTHYSVLFVGVHSLHSHPSFPQHQVGATPDARPLACMRSGASLLFLGSVSLLYLCIGSEVYLSQLLEAYFEIQNALFAFSARAQSSAC